MTRREFADGTICREEGARQSDAAQADINAIVKRFEKQGVLPLVRREGQYLDVSEISDYRSALEQVAKADEYFMSLPADSRAKFDNDPARFLDAVNDPAQLALLQETGVIPKDEVVAPVGGAVAPVAAPSVSDVPVVKS